MKKILSLILAFTFLITICGCQNNSLVRPDDNSSNISRPVSSADDDYVFDLEKVSLPEEYYDFSRIKILNNKTFLSARKETNETNFYYRVYETHNDNNYDVIGTSEILKDITSCGEKIYTLGQNTDESCEYSISRYIDGKCDKKIRVSGKEILSSENYIVSYGGIDKTIYVYDTELNEKNSISLNDYNNYINSNYQIAFDDELSFYIISYDKEINEFKLLKTDKNNNTEYISEDFYDLAASCTGEINGFFVNNNKLYLAVDAKNGDLITQFINVIDLKTGETTDRIELENALQVRKGGPKYDFTYSDGKSIYGYNSVQQQDVCLYTNPENFSYSDSWDIRESGLIIYETEYDGLCCSNVILALDDNFNILSVLPSDIKNFDIYQDKLYYLTEETSENSEHIVNINCTRDGNDCTLWWQGNLNDNFVISNFYITENNVVFLGSEGKTTIVYNYNPDGNLIGTIDFEYSETSTISRINNELYAIWTDKDRICSAALNLSDNTIENITEIPVKSDSVIFLDNPEETLYYDTQENIIYSYTDDSSYIYYNLSHSDISRIEDVLKISESEYLFTESDYEGNLSVWKTVKRIYEDTAIIIAGFDIPQYYRDAAKKYTESNSNVNFQFKDYAEQNTEVINRYNKLNEDIASGEIPDIIITDGSFDFDNYAQTGLFYDLYPDLASDTTFFEKYSDITFRYTNSNLFQIIPVIYDIYVFTLPQDKSNTICDLDSLCNFLNSDSVILSSREKTEQMVVAAFITECLESSESGFNIDQETLCKLLSGLKKLHSSFDNEQIYENTDLEGLSYYEYVCNLRKNSKVIPDIQLGQNKYLAGIAELCGISVSSSSENKDKCVDFIKYMLSDEIQKTHRPESGDIIANKKIFKTELEKTVNPEYFNFLTNSTDDEINIKVLFNISGSKIYDILINEIHEYYDNGNTEEKTAELILKKIRMYLSETK